MKKYLYPSLLSTALVLLCGCASTAKTTYRESPPPKPGTMIQDQRYVMTVETIARQRGTQVVWVNPPKKRVVESVAAAR